MKFKEGGGNSSKHFLKLKAGESIRGVFRGEPYDFKQHWHENRGTVCKGDDCELCAEKKKPAFRFRLNFVMNENGIYVAKIFEQGWTVYGTLRALSSDYELERTLVKVTRHGSGTDTTYSIVPIPKSEVGDELNEKLSSVELHDLENPSEDNGENNHSDANEDVPF